jgi:hypothetical protein
MSIKYTKLQIYIPNGHKIYQPIPCPPKFTQIVFWGLKIYRLATLENATASINLFVPKVCSEFKRRLFGE